MFAVHHLVDTIQPYFIASIIRVAPPLLMTGSNKAAVTPKEYIRHPHYISKWRSSGELRVNGDVKDAAGWKTHNAKRNVNRSNSERRKKVKKKSFARRP